MSLLWPWMLALLPLPWLPRIGFRAQPAGAALRLPSRSLLPLPDLAAPAPRRTLGPVSPWAAAIWVLLVVAAARPAVPLEGEAQRVSGRELLIALDVSRSMSTRDLQMEGQAVARLDAARRLAREFVARRAGDRVGLIVFGSRAYLHTPLTFDLAAIDQALADTAIGLAGEDTALGDAIALATTRANEFAGSERALVLLTDGANTAGELSPTQAGWLAKRAGLRLHIVGIGAESMRVADAQGVRSINPSADLDEATLTALARQTGGSYHRATDTAALAAFYHAVDALEPTALTDAALRPVRELYPWPLALTLLLTTAALARRARLTLPVRRPQ